MSRRTTGVVFIAISAFLYATRFITAAIWGAGLTNWNADLFNSMLGYVDQGLTAWSIAALVIGLIYMLWAEIKATKQKSQSPKDQRR